MNYAKPALIGLPPTANNIYANRPDGKGRIKTTEYRTWRTAAARTLEETFEPFWPKTPIEIEVYLSINRQRDVDNCVKPIIDAVKTAGLIRDDRWVDHVEAWRCAPDQVPAGMALVFLGVLNTFDLTERLLEIAKHR